MLLSVHLARFENVECRVIQAITIVGIGQLKYNSQIKLSGYIQDEDIPKSPSNATCEAIRAQRKDDNIACFDPVVYTTGSQFAFCSVDYLYNVTHI
jgi:hypothetical protein